MDDAADSAIRIFHGGVHMQHIVQQLAEDVTREDKDDPFFICDLDDVTHKHVTWKQSLPGVQPFYAVKCNDDPVFLQTLADIGTGFDCASKVEIEQILKLNVAPSRVIYANPCKQRSHIEFAVKNHVTMMTFDNEEELHKIKAVTSDAELVIRILPPDESHSHNKLGNKYGVETTHARDLLRVARELDLNVIGVSFHVGSGCSDPASYVAAVTSARVVFDMAAVLDFKFRLLDIGGGFAGDDAVGIPFSDVVDVLKPALDELFPACSGVRVIAEPGRYFAASAFSLAVNVIGRRTVLRNSSTESHKNGMLTHANGCDVSGPSYMYYVNDGVYGSFICTLLDASTYSPHTIKDQEGHTYVSSVWGPTCCGLDCIICACQLPLLDIGDWLYFRDMGAYTSACATQFKGVQKPHTYYITTGRYTHLIKNKF